MNAANNKALVEKTWRAYCAGDMGTALANIAEDVHWVINAKIPGVPAVHNGHEAMRAVSATAPAMFPSGLKQEVTSLTGEGDVVVMEYRMSGHTAKGRIYENSYCLVCKLSNGKIADIREYTDTYHIANVVLEKLDNAGRV